MRKTIAATIAATGLMLGAASADAVPLSPKTCLKDRVKVDCVKRTWHPQAPAQRTWQGKVFNPATR